MGVAPGDRHAGSTEIRTGKSARFVVSNERDRFALSHIPGEEIMKRFVIATCIVAALLLPMIAAAENALYDGAFTAPRCTSAVSPCDTGGTLINGRDNVAGITELNQPNTIAASPCADDSGGGSGWVTRWR
jgi:hypothetical protein